MTDAAVQNAAAGATAPLDDATSRRNRVAIALLLAAVFVVFLNETVMSVAVPPIMKDLGITPSAGQWLTTAFALTTAIVVIGTANHWVLDVVVGWMVVIAGFVAVAAFTPRLHVAAPTETELGTEARQLTT